MAALESIDTLRGLLSLIANTGDRILASLDTSTRVPKDQKCAALPSMKEHADTNTLIGAGAMLSALLQDPSERLMAMTSQFFEARALHFAAKECIADRIEAAGPKGLGKVPLATQLGVDVGKLARVMRLLATAHIFNEVGPDTWTNTPTSSALVGNAELRATVFGAGATLYPTGEPLLWHLSDQVRSHSYDPFDAPFCDVHGKKSMFEWLCERDEHGEPRKELELFHLAMVGAGRTAMPGIVADYPWGQLGKAKIVDMGGGIGGACMALADAFPQLQFVVQDRQEVVAKARDVWKRQLPQHAGRIEFSEHNFFQTQPILDADIFFMRFIMHDWNDEGCLAILRNLKPALERHPHSRILIADRLVVTAYGSDLLPEETRAPAPLPANYGAPARATHIVDMTMCANLNSCERTPAEFKKLIEAAGLRLVRFWPCRSSLGLVEAAAIV